MSHVNDQGEIVRGEGQPLRPVEGSHVPKLPELDAHESRLLRHARWCSVLSVGLSQFLAVVYCVVRKLGIGEKTVDGQLHPMTLWEQAAATGVLFLALGALGLWLFAWISVVPAWRKRPAYLGWALLPPLGWMLLFLVAQLGEWLPGLVGY